MNKFFSLRRVLAIAALLLGLLLLYPIFFSTPALRSPEEVSVRLDAAPNNLNPFLNGGHAPSTYIARQTFQTLGDLDPKTLEMTPMLVQRIPAVRIVEDGPRKGEYVYDFEIQKDAVWDNGSPVTGEDVAFTLKLIFHPGLPLGNYQGYLRHLSAVEVDPVNPRKFSIYFRSYYMLALETICSIAIYQASHYDAASRLKNVPLSDFLDTAKTSILAADVNVKAFVEEISQPKFANDPNAISGSGPYRLERMNDQGAIMVKKENWWGDKLADKFPSLRAYPKKLVYKVVKDDPTLENMVKNGELDLVGGAINPAQFLEMKASDSLAAKFDFLTLGYTQYNRWVLNHRNPILADVEVRKALRHIVDYDYMVNQVQRGMAIRIASPMPPNRPYYAKNLPLPDYNITRAREILTNAGWADTDGDGILDKVINGKKQALSIRLMAALTIKTNELIANSLKESARQAGIEIVVIGADLAVMSADTRSGNYDSALLGVALFPGLVEFYQRFHSKSLAPAGDNRAGYVSERADKLIEAIRTEPDVAKRNALYLEVQQVLYDEIPEIIMFAPLQRIIISKKFEPGVETENRPGYNEHFARLRQEG